MGILIDLHIHTRLHSPCSQIDPEKLVHQAVKAGLHGLVITEHQYQWKEEDLAGLGARADERCFLLMTGFEYASSRGDILIYGLGQGDSVAHPPGLPPEAVVNMVHERGGVCIAAHPTRAGMGFDERVLTMGVDAIEVRSGNLKEHEQRLAVQLAADAGLRPVTSSDAHNIHDVGKYVTEFADPIRSMADLVAAIRKGRFRPGEHARAGVSMGDKLREGQ